MADKKISQLTPATLPLAGTEVLPIVQSGTTDNITVNNLAAGNLKSNATTGVLQVTGPAAASTRVMTTPNANFTVARTDAAQTFTGLQTFNGSTQVPTGQSSLYGTTGFTASIHYNANGNLSIGPRSGYGTQLDNGNLVIAESGKGIVMKNAAGTITKLVRLNDTGDGFVFENA